MINKWHQSTLKKTDAAEVNVQAKHEGVVVNAQNVQHKWLRDKPAECTSDFKLEKYQQHDESTVDSPQLMTPKKATFFEWKRKKNRKKGRMKCGITIERTCQAEKALNDSKVLQMLTNVKYGWEYAENKKQRKCKCGIVNKRKRQNDKRSAEQNALLKKMYVSH